MGEPTFDIDSVYRYLVPYEFKSRLRGAGITGGLSAAVSIVSTLYNRLLTFPISHTHLQMSHLSSFIRVRQKKPWRILTAQ